jgi:hypothetical protein
MVAVLSANNHVLNVLVFGYKSVFISTAYKLIALVNQNTLPREFDAF